MGLIERLTQTKGFMYIYDEEVKVAITLNEDMKSVTAAVLSGNNVLRK